MTKADDDYPFQRSFETGTEYEARILRSLRAAEAAEKPDKNSFLTEDEMEKEMDQMFRELRDKREEEQAERVANLVVKKLKQQKYAAI